MQKRYAKARQMMDACKEASLLVRRAIALLDSTDAPSDIAATLDLASQRIQRLITASDGQKGKVTEIASKY